VTGELALGAECEGIQKPSQWTVLAKRLCFGVKTRVVTKNGIQLQVVSAYELGGLNSCYYQQGLNSVA